MFSRCRAHRTVTNSRARSVVAILILSVASVAHAQGADPVQSPADAWVASLLATMSGRIDCESLCAHDDDITDVAAFCADTTRESECGGVGPFGDRWIALFAIFTPLPHQQGWESVELGFMDLQTGFDLGEVVASGLAHCNEQTSDATSWSGDCDGARVLVTDGSLGVEALRSSSAIHVVSVATTARRASWKRHIDLFTRTRDAAKRSRNGL